MSITGELVHIYVNSSLDVHENTYGLRLSCASSKHSSSGIAGYTHHPRIHESQREIRHSTYYDSHVQFVAGRVHLRSLGFLSARAVRACRTRPRAQFSLV